MKNRFFKIFNNEIVQFLTLLCLTALVLFFTPKVFHILFFCGLLFLFWKSKKGYFWLVFTLVLSFDIGGIFYGQTSDIMKFGPISISFSLLFTIVSFIKYYNKPLSVKFHYKKPFVLALIYLFFLMYLGFFIYGNEGGGKSGLRYYFTTLIMLIHLLNIITIPKILDSPFEIEQFAKLIFLSLIVNIFGQVYHILNGVPIYAQYGVISEEIHKANFIEKLIRPVWGHVNILIGIIIAIFYLLTNSSRFKQNYLLSIIFISLISVFIGATRGWIIALSFLFIVFLILNRFFKTLKTIFFGFCFFSVLLISSPAFKIQVFQVLDRLASMEKLAKGDATAGGTNARLTTRHDKVIDVFYRYPIFGAGFSTEAMEKNDMHVGNQNILMAGGIIGYLIIAYFWMYYLFKNAIIYARLTKKNPYRKGVLFLNFALLATILIHSTSTSLYGYLEYEGSPEKVLLLVILFTVFNQFLLIASTNEKRLIYG